MFYDKSIAHGFLLRISPLKTASTTPSGFLAGQVLDFDITLEGAVPVKLDMNDKALSSGTHYTIDGSRVYGSVAITSSLHHGEYTFLDIECSAEPTGYTIQYFRVFPSSDAAVTAETPVTKTENHTLYAGWSKIVPVTITFVSSNFPSTYWSIG